jgi:hypothetical protein
MAGPSNLKRSFLPGSYTEVSPLADGSRQVYPAHEVRPDLQGLKEIIYGKQQAIREGLYNDLFKMLALNDAQSRRDVTATEIAERHEEKLIQLGPVLERLHAEGFIPLIDLVFSYMIDLDMIPPWPEELDEMPLKVEFISILAQAQKMVATGAVDHFAGFIGANAELFPELPDVVDADAMGDEYADYLGIPAKLIRPQEDRDARRQQRADDAQAAQAAQLAEQGSATARNLSGAKTGDQNALEALLGGVA